MRYASSVVATLIVVALVFITLPVARPTVIAQSPSDTAMLAKIRAEGIDHSQVAPVFETLTIDIGPRLTASPAHRRAVQFVRDRLASYGLQNVHTESWKFGRGWEMKKLTVEMVEPRYLPLIGYADAWSTSTPGDVVGSPVFVGNKAVDELASMRGQLKGAIVMAQPLMTTFVRADRPNPSDPQYVPNSAAYATSVGQRANASNPYRRTQEIAQALKEAGAAVILKPSIGEHGTVFVTGRDGGPDAVPSITLSGEHYNMIARMLDHHIPVALRVNVQTSFDNESGLAENVIGEIPGTDPAVRDEVVMLGGHLDSWHTGVGATDNADGSTTMIEAMRILKAVGAQPRRTIRVALWGGEEQGLLGSKAWVDEHLEGDSNRVARDKFDVYFNIDNGYGPIYGFYLQESAAVRPLFDAWLAPFKDLGARKNTMEPVGSTDHLSFIAAGVPGFNPIQKYSDYDVRTHHTNMDTVERVDEKDISQAAIIMASFAYQAAMAEHRIPRDRVPSP